MAQVQRRSPLEECDMPCWLYADNSLPFLKYLIVAATNLLDSRLPFSRVQVQMIYLGIVYPHHYRQSIHMSVQVHLQVALHPHVRMVNWTNKQWCHHSKALKKYKLENIPSHIEPLWIFTLIIYTIADCILEGRVFATVRSLACVLQCSRAQQGNRYILGIIKEFYPTQFAKPSSVN